MPHRSIAMLDGKVLVDVGSDSSYHGREMSDGERVTLYLLGQCLAAPDGSMIIVDEPELHLHKTLMDKLWNKVEELCPSKFLVYITHDLDFAASRTGAKKIWTQSYDTAGWIWSEIPHEDALPEALILEIIGSRKPILFCEGDLDNTVYQLCFPDLHVVQRGGAEKVIEATKALSENSVLHTLQVYGIVDRDVRSDDEIERLRQHQIYVLDFAEIENLLCMESIVRLIASHLSLDPDETLGKVTQLVLNALNDELEIQIVMRAERRIRYRLSRYSRTTSDQGGLDEGFRILIGSTKVEEIYLDAKQVFRDTIESGNLNTILRVYNRKTLIDRISPTFGLNKGGYLELILRLLKSDKSSELLHALRRALPDLRPDGTSAGAAQSTSQSGVLAGDVSSASNGEDIL